VVPAAHRKVGAPSRTPPWGARQPTDFPGSIIELLRPQPSKEIETGRCRISQPARKERPVGGQERRHVRQRLRIFIYRTQTNTQSPRRTCAVVYWQPRSDFQLRSRRGLPQTTVWFARNGTDGGAQRDRNVCAAWTNTQSPTCARGTRGDYNAPKTFLISELAWPIGSFLMARSSAAISPNRSSSALAVT
jgi:hypothetical protein